MNAALVSVFEALFKYRPVVFERGTLAFGADWPTYLIALLALAVAVPALLGTLRLRAGLRPRDRVVLVTLRGLAVLLVLGCLARPALLLSAAAPQRNVVAVLLDDSRSMQIADVGEANGTRADAVRARFAADGALMRALGDRFVVRTYRFSRTAERAPGAQALGFDGTGTSLAAAVRQVRDELTGVALAGVVLVTDGADNADSTVGGDDALLASGPRVPVYTVGVGAEHPAVDVELAAVDAPRTVLAGGTMVAEVALVQYGLAGEAAQLVVEDGGRVIAAQTVPLPDDGVRRTVRVPIAVDEPGERHLTVRVTPHGRERTTGNNTRELLVTVQGDRERVLYLEGEPRYELKFARRAVAADPRLQLIALQRTAENKFLRLGVDDSLELMDGFPATPEALYGYRAVIIGSIEASYFTAAQQRLLADYVSERGGSVLFLGGRRSFREGGYAGTPLAEVMPVQLADGRDAADSDYLAEVAVTPTAAGQAHAVTQVGPTPDSSAARWRTLPPLTTVNRLRGVKPGATVLLAAGSGADATPVLAFQRYGRGMAAALVVQDSWLWQMHADIPLEDQTHERFWRQLLRWLASDVPARSSITAASPVVDAGDAPVELRAEVRDSAYRGVNGATVVASVRAPSGAVQSVPLTWTGERDGEYRGRYAPAEDGVHDVRLVADLGAEKLESDGALLRTSDGAAEWFDAGRRDDLLKRLADETGGRPYTLADVDGLAKDIVYTAGGNTVVERLDIWDMPIVLLLLVGLLTAEWAYRRVRGVV